MNPTMLSYLLLILAASGYLCASFLLLREVRSSADSSGSEQLSGVAFIAALAGIAGHLGYAWLEDSISIPLNFSLSAMSLLISAILVLVFLAGCLIMPIRRLGILVYPLTALSLLFAFLWDSEANFVSGHGTAFSAHILISILAYSLLTIAAIQALLFYYQDRQIKNHNRAAILMALPPLQTMEQLLFRLLATGFIFLTLTLLSGAIFSQQIFGQAFALKHHTILALLGWLVYATLLFKRVKSGLRGSQAVIWTIAGFVLIQLGYFGTKMVSESLNIQ